MADDRGLFAAFAKPQVTEYEDHNDDNDDGDHREPDD